MAAPWQLELVPLVDALRRRELSAVETLESVLQRADAVGPIINPFALRLDERAHAAALDADRLLARGEGGALCGVPLAIKDSQWLAGVPSPVGCIPKVGFTPDRTSILVERVIDAGAAVFATTTTSELCYSGVTDTRLNGVTRNPRSLDRVAGGSSGGAGAAVAAGLGPVALGGDGGGSIRIPAAFNGVVGFKPTFGLVPREPCGAAWKTIVSAGPLARSVADARLLLGVLAGHDARDRHSVAGGASALPRPLDELVVVASVDLGHAPVDDDVREAFEATIDELAAAGVRVVRDDPGLGTSVRTWAAIAAAEAWYADGHLLVEHGDELGATAAAFLAFGSTISAADYVAAGFTREHIHAAYVELLDRHGAHVLLTPTLGCEAFPEGRVGPERIGDREISPPWLDWAGFLYDGNLAGLPAASVPIGLGDEGLPVALQVIGRRATDAIVLDVAAHVEALADFDARPVEPVTAVDAHATSEAAS